MNRQDQDVKQSNGKPTNSQGVERRTSRRRSEVRHGKIYDEVSPTTIRAVTPESATSTTFDITALPSPPSFGVQALGSLQNRDHSASVSNTDDDTPIDSRRRKSKKKARNSDLIPSDTSPNSFFEKTRKRLGSITNAGGASARSDDPISSIGYPSVIQPTAFSDLQDRETRNPSTPRRTISSDSPTNPNPNSFRSPLVLDSDSSRILTLMKTTCGRMHGILFYRPIGTSAWLSGYCAINVAPGSLVCQTKGDLSTTEVLIPDLRGCSVRTHYDVHSLSTYLSVVLPVAGFGFQLRPPVPETFDSWLAALLCWQPLRPKGIHNKMSKPQSITMSDSKKTANQRRLSDISNTRSTAIVKAGQMVMWDGPLPSGSQRHQAKRLKTEHLEEHHSWKRVNCTLHENGTLRFLSEQSNSNLRTVRLSHLARCSVQKLDSSVLDAPNCIIIYTQHTLHPSLSPHDTPVVLCLASRTAFEAWFVLLRALTVPELYGPEIAPKDHSDPSSPSTAGPHLIDMVRIERSLSIKITEAKLPRIAPTEVLSPPIADKHSKQQKQQKPPPQNDLYADVLLGRDLRARTAAKPYAKSAFWAEEFVIEDLPSTLSRVSVAVKIGNADEKEWTMITDEGYELPGGDDMPGFEGIEVSSHDPVFGRVDIAISDLEQEKALEKWWPLYDNNQIQVGQVLMKLNLAESVVLMESEYAQLNDLLQRFDNSLTTQIAQVLGPELKQLSDVLLDIFQAADKVEDWIDNLIEEEIDGIYKDVPPVRMRFSGRIHSNDSYESAEQRELLVRDLSRSATMEANLLFRGNSLVTKALDAHMRRMGRDYLEMALGEKLRAIVINDPNCEVDPTRVKSHEQLEKNWANLLTVTDTIWKAIASSAEQCPPSIRKVLKHVQSCAEDRYGSFIRTVKYTSVSGFLFLRFFCPAILNPKLFGLFDDHPPERPRRTFTLIAKSLIVLANMSKFGQKEPWMEPMNKFLGTATPEFKKFIDKICSFSYTQPAYRDPQYQASMQIRSRLPALSREGLPTLPFLLDLPKLDSMLIDIWVENAPSDVVETDVEECVKEFHDICLKLKKRTKECMSHAERAEEPDEKLEKRWQQMLSDQNKQRSEMSPYEDFTTEGGITALPQAPDSQRNWTRYNNSAADHAKPRNEPSSNLSPHLVSDSRRVAGTNARTMNQMVTNSANSSTASFDTPDEASKKRQQPNNSSKSKVLPLASRRKPKPET